MVSDKDGVCATCDGSSPIVVHRRKLSTRYERVVHEHTVAPSERLVESSALVQACSSESLAKRSEELRVQGH